VNCVNSFIKPEPIAGSTRMKGGSATKILLHAIFATSLMRLQHLSLYAVHNSLVAKPCAIGIWRRMDGRSHN